MKNEEKVRFSHMRSVTFFGLIGILSIAILYIFLPFFYPIFWAGVISIVFYPIYKVLDRHIKSPSVNSGLMLLIVLAVLIIPLTLFSLLIINESTKLFNSVTESNVVPSADNVTEGLTSWAQGTVFEPYISGVREKWTEYAQSASKVAGGYVLGIAKSITQLSAKFLLMFFLMLYTLFFFFRDGEKMVKRVMHLSPLGDRYEAMLVDRFTATIRATLKGTFIVGGIQGILGGLLFAFVGVPGALVWGVIMIVMALIPAIGPSIVWAPAGIIMLSLGYTWQGLTILIFGFAVISVIDNLLRPIIVGKDIEMHPVIVLFSTLGGLILFGLSGFIIGPVIAALYMAVVSIYDHYYENELEQN